MLHAIITITILSANISRTKLHILDSRRWRIIC